MAEVSYSFLCLNIGIVLVLLLLLQFADCQSVHILASPCGNAGKNSFFIVLSVVNISLCGIL